jgi:hypothetical protein
MPTVIRNLKNLFIEISDLGIGLDSFETRNLSETFDI